MWAYLADVSAWCLLRVVMLQVKTLGTFAAGFNVIRDLQVQP